MLNKFFNIFSAACLLVGLSTFAYANNQAGDLSSRIQRIDALYQQVFQDPANVELNIALVREQIAAHDFKGASGTLERLLIIAPNNRTAQFLMARVKSATENYQEARYFLLEVINAEDSDEKIKSNAETFLKELDDLTDGFAWSANIGINAGFSNNPDAKPNNPSYSLLAPTVPIDVRGGNQEYRGASLSGQFEAQLNTYEKRVLRANLSHQRRDFMTYNKADYETFGAQFQLLNSDETPFLGALNLTRIRVHDYDFMDQVGISAQQTVPLSPRYRIDGTGSITRHVNRNNPHFSGNTAKTGYQTKVDLGMDVGFIGYSLRVGAGYERKLANTSTNSYHQEKITIGTTIPLSMLRIGTNLQVAKKRTDQADDIFSDRRRDDTTATLAMNVMLPIKSLNQYFDNKMALSLSGNVSKTESNVKKFNTTKGEMTLNLNYSFGGD